MKIGMLTSGGDCQGLNPSMRAVAKSLYETHPKAEIIGFLDGYKGLIENNYKVMKPKNFSSILTLGGTILGTSRQPYKLMNSQIDPSDPNSPTKLDSMLKTLDEHKLDCLVILGGNGSHKSAYLLHQNKIPVITLPKTIDNDLWGTERTFGFQSAINIATEVIDGIHTTAASHSRVFIVEIMGNKVGWLTLHAGIASGADIVLIPEIPYSIEVIDRVIKQRKENNKNYTIIAMAEGAVSQEMLEKGKPYIRSIDEQYVNRSYHLGNVLKEKLGLEVRITIPGHFQRGGVPSAYDRVLCTRLGGKAAELIRQQHYGVMVGIKDNKTAIFPLSDVANKLKYVDSDNELLRFGRSMGISFGDETNGTKKYK